jgi:hypothetical protein
MPLVDSGGAIGVLAGDGGEVSPFRARGVICTSSSTTAPVSTSVSLSASFLSDCAGAGEGEVGRRTTGLGLGRVWLGGGALSSAASGCGSISAPLSSSLVTSAALLTPLAVVLRPFPPAAGRTSES